MRLGTRNLNLYFRGSMSLRTTDPPEVVRGRWLLSLYRHHKDPNWVFFVRGTHRSEDVVSWFLAKTLLRIRVAQEDFQMGTYLAAGSDLGYHALRKVQHLVGSSKAVVPSPYHMHVWPTLDLLVQSERICRSYRPLYYPYRHWSPQSIPPERVIGVGYKDHGNLSTSPSWKDQVLTNADELPKEVSGNLGILASLLHSLPDSPGRRV